MTKDEAAPMFDWALYGMVVRKRRIELGYKKAEHFAASMWRRVRFAISRDSLYKIEQGKQVPTGTQVLAINMALYGQPFPAELFDICAMPAWKSMARNARAAIDESGADYDGCDIPEFVPELWRRQNFGNGLFEGGYEERLEDNPDGSPNYEKIEPTPTVREMAYRLNENPFLFLD
ncbi:MAG: hypothetical protein RRZ85_06235 [Gordonibacter sp.]|uniref:hypothetical protein n=1 Tax=Gordonibacter sp. TaxID=1968902 RepID=UPI002FC5DD0C